MTRELKLSLILGFSLVLIVTVLISDYLSKARTSRLNDTNPSQPVAMVTPPRVEDLIPGGQEPAPAPTRVANVSDRGSGLVSPTGSSGPEYQPTEIDQGTGRVVPAGVDEPKKIATPDAGKAPLPGNAEATLLAADKTYTIGEDDTLYKISRQHYKNANLWKQLALYNKINPSNLKVGTQIKIPTVEILTGKMTKPAVSQEPLNAKGPTLESDAARLAINDGDDRIDPLIRTENAAPRQAVDPKVEPKESRGAVKTDDGKPESMPESKPVKPGSYTVKRGDTLGHIAARELGSSRRYAEILHLNSRQLESEDDLRVGMVLKLPAK